MLNELQYSVTSSQWAAGGRGSIAAEGVEKTIEFSAPPEFHGEAGVWTPEHFLLAAVASCFMVTFRAIAGFSKFEPVALDITVEGTLSKSPAGYDFTAVVIRPRLKIVDESQRTLASRLLAKTERGCLVARALKCEVKMEANVESPANAAVAENEGVLVP